MVLPNPVASVAGAEPYRVPVKEGPVRLRLHASEGPPPPPSLLEAMRTRASGVLNHYPDAGSLQALLARRLGLDPAQVLVTAGADEAIDRVCRAYLDAGRGIVLPDPGFEVIARCAALAGAELRTYRWMQGRFPVRAVRERVGAGAGVVSVVTPHNPTGLAMDEAELRAVAEGSRGALLMVDLAYVDFARVDLTRVALEYEHAVVLRTLSKAWGLAGLRIGYACGHPEVIAGLRAAGTPYAVSSMSLWLAEHWLRTGESRHRAYVAATRERRARLSELLRAAGAEVWPSQANFVLARVEGAAALREALAARGITVRGYPGHPLLGDCLRVGCPPDDEAMRFFGDTLAAIRGGLGG